MFKTLAAGLKIRSKIFGHTSNSTLPPSPLWTLGDGGQHDPAADELEKVLTNSPAGNASEVPLTVNQNVCGTAPSKVPIPTYATLANSVRRTPIGWDFDRKEGIK